MWLWKFVTSNHLHITDYNTKSMESFIMDRLNSINLLSSFQWQIHHVDWTRLQAEEPSKVEYRHLQYSNIQSETCCNIHVMKLFDATCYSIIFTCYMTARLLPLVSCRKLNTLYSCTWCSIITTIHQHNLVNKRFIYTKIPAIAGDNAVWSAVRISSTIFCRYHVMSAPLWRQNVVTVTASWWVIITRPFYCHCITVE